MYTDEVLDLVMRQKGVLSQEQYLDIYDHSPQMKCVFFDEDADYQFEMVFNDKEESIFFNVKAE